MKLNEQLSKQTPEWDVIVMEASGLELHLMPPAEDIKPF
jgi:hypothetical protein